MNIATLLARHGRYRPAHTALVFEGRRLTWQALNAEVNRLANALLLDGVHKGERLATVLPNCVELLLLYWAAAKVGAVVVPGSTLLKAPALGAMLRDSASTRVFVTAEHAASLDTVRQTLPALRDNGAFLVGGGAGEGWRSLDALVGDAPATAQPPAGLAPSDPYNIIYSSGTTGEPKGIVHSHRVRAMYCTLFASAWRMTPESIVLHTGSIVFNGAFVTLMPALGLGATYVLHRAFDPAALVETVEREGVTHLMLVPSQIVALLDCTAFAPERLDSLEMICSLGAPLHREHKQRLTGALPGRFYELYGLTEGFVTILDREDYPAKPDSVGVPPPFFEMRIEDVQGRELPAGEVGEIVGRGPIMMPGYHERPDLTRAAIRDGWLLTGDLGHVDDDGYLYLVDRQKDLIISGGVNVYPRDIEEVAVCHPLVREAAVFGMPDAKWGEAPVLAVVLTGHGALEPAELVEWVNARVAAKFQRVREALVMEDFPRNVAGKVLKRVIRDALVGRG